MRYKNNEQTTLGGFFETGKSVTIKILDSYGQLVSIDSNACTEAPDEDSLYLWSTENMNASAGTYFYVMTDGVNKMRGKFVYGGYVENVAEKLDLTNSIVEIQASIQDSGTALRAIIEDVQLGNWTIENKQMIMKTTSGDELARFNLYDFNGNPTNTTVAKRVRIS